MTLALCSKNIRLSRYVVVLYKTHSLFLDPVGSLVSTLLVGCWLVVGCHTFSKFVYFECFSVVMMVCWIFRVLEC